MRRLVLFALAVVTATTCCTTIKGVEGRREEPTPGVESQSLPPVAAPEPAAPAQPVFAEIALRGPIDHKVSSKFVRALSTVAKMNVAGVVFEIDSTGGGLDDGFAMVKAMEEFPGRVICVVDGQADSEAFALLQGCDVRYMTRRSKLMIHEPFTIEDVPLNSTNLTTIAHRQKVSSFAWTEGLVRRMKISAATVRERIRHGDWWLTCDDAMQIGAIDGIVLSPKTVWLATSSGMPVPLIP